MMIDKRVNKINDFIKRVKFELEKEIFYPGIHNHELKYNMTLLINQIAIDFIEVVNKSSLKQDFHEKISVGLTRIDPYRQEINSEDEDRVCMYIEEIMDIVELKDSGGILNNWRYGFDLNGT